MKGVSVKGEMNKRGNKIKKREKERREKSVEVR